MSKRTFTQQLLPATAVRKEKVQVMITAAEMAALDLLCTTLDRSRSELGRQAIVQLLRAHHAK